MKKIGIYSGTFDPVHEGHISFALETAKKAGLDKVFFLPEPRPRRKQGVKALEHRVEMVKLAIKDYKNLGVIVLEQARFTPHETLPVLQARFEGAELYMLMGEDMLDHLADWPHVDELVSGVSFIIGLRKRHSQEVEEIISSMMKTRALQLQYRLVETSNSKISSSTVRTALRRGKKMDGVNPEVWDYIVSNSLYSRLT